MPLLTKIGNRIAALPLVSTIINKSKTTSLPGFRGIPLYDVVLFFVGQVRTIGMTERASAIAFNFVGIYYPMVC